MLGYWGQVPVRSTQAQHALWTGSPCTLYVHQSSGSMLAELARSSQLRTCRWTPQPPSATACMPRPGADVRCLAALPASSLVLPPVLPGSATTRNCSAGPSTSCHLLPFPFSAPYFVLLHSIQTYPTPNFCLPLPPCISTAPFPSLYPSPLLNQLTSHG